MIVHVIIEKTWMASWFFFSFLFFPIRIQNGLCHEVRPIKLAVLGSINQIKSNVEFHELIDDHMLQSYMEMKCVT